MLSLSMRVALCACVVAPGRALSAVGRGRSASKSRRGGGPRCGMLYDFSTTKDYTCCATRGVEPATLGVEPACVRSSDIERVRKNWLGVTITESDCALFATSDVPEGSKWEMWSKVDPKNPCDSGSKMFAKQGGKFVRMFRSYADRQFDANITLSPGEYYSRGFGHWPEDLEVMYRGLQESTNCSRFVWFAGDSTLDNNRDLAKFPGYVPMLAVAGYAQVLQPSWMYPDVSYMLNTQLQAQYPQQRFCVVNTAKAGSTLGGRVGPDGKLTPQDKVLRDRMSEDDVLIVSVGGNDFGRWPGLMYMAALVLQDSTKILTGQASGLQHFVTLFRDGMAEYIGKLMSKRKPNKVIFSMQYYLREAPGGNKLLPYANYDKHPDRLQAVIQRLFIDAITKIKLNGTSMHFVPMYHTLDGTNADDYLPDRVHLSVEGGRKMAQTLIPYIAG